MAKPGLPVTMFFNLFQRACLAIFVLFLSANSNADESKTRPKLLAPGVIQFAGVPTAYMVYEGQQGVVIGPPGEVRLDDLKAFGVDTIETILLTHGHRDAVAGVEEWIARGVPVRASQASAAWLSPAGVETFWSKSLPPILPDKFPPLMHRQWAVWSYHVLPRGVAEIHCDLNDHQELQLAGWKLRVVAMPGHSRDHVAIVAEPADANVMRIAFCGDAICAPGKIWTPYTTDWHHATDEGLASAAESLRRLAAEKPTMLCPEHGVPIVNDVPAALEETVRRLQRAADLKSFEKFRLAEAPNLPQPKFLAPQQVGTATPEGNTQPWTQLSPHLFVTGNTYALASRDGPLLLVDPYDRGLPARLDELKQEHKVGPAELAVITHAHNDHYTGLFALPEPKPAVWVIDRIADCIMTPRRYRAPYVDPRPASVQRRLQSGQEIPWREYILRFDHQPGQTEFANSIEVTVDGKRVMFTGDNFYRADQYSGSGGWSGHNRGLPGGYEASIARLIERKPDWVLTEHGGAMEFDREDFELRRRWARAAAQAADALSPSGDHRVDWNPHRVSIEPQQVTARAGESIDFELVATNPTDNIQRIVVGFQKAEELTIAPRETIRKRFNMPIAQESQPGRMIVPISVTLNGQPDSSDVFIVIDVRAE